MHAREHPSNEGAIAIYAADNEVRHRIGSALALADYEIFDCVGPVEELTAGRHAGLRALVLTASLERLGHEDRVVRLRRRLGSLRLVVVATGPYNPTAWKVVRSGVEGLVRESELELTLRPTVEAVLADQLCIPRAMRQALAEPVFSHREKQVLELVLSGLTNGAIADRLYLSESTVKSHLSSSFRKLGVSSRSEAAQRVLTPAALSLQA